ncbi:MAG: ATP synthase F1 subunit gamma [Planctomycetes bacterium]|nr:ATP synthase F1 subunit gamma [Planctomycetota bacterium]
MAKARAIATRRKSVESIKKITYTMQLIATARFQKALTRATETKPYTEKITELVRQVSASGAAAEHPLLQVNADAKRHALLLITSNRGFCGGYNGNLLRTAMSLVTANGDAGITTDLFVIGKKGVNYLSFLGHDLAQTYPDLPDAPEFAEVEVIASGFMKDYEAKTYDAVHVVYMKFITTSRQTAEAMTLLPIKSEDDSADTEQPAKGGVEVQYDFSPEPSILLRELLPVTVKVRLFQCFSDAAVSENVARMVAMKSASDSARDMAKSLAQKFNRARQSQITTELLDIMGGVEALK